MKYEYHKVLEYLFERIIPTITDERINIYSRHRRCLYCSNLFDEKDELKTSFLQIYIEKQKEGNDVVWVLKFERNCVRCNSYEKETTKLKYITRDADYEIVYPTRSEEEHMLKEKCKKCGSNLYHRTSSCAGSGSSQNFCKKCGFSGMSTFWD